MTDTLPLIREFHETFSHPVKDAPDVGNTALNALRVSLLREELGELEDALNGNDAQEAFDALCDLQYVLDGAFLALGFHRAKHAGVQEVHDSNMSKLGADGKPVIREDGKILKGPSYRKPDLARVLREVFGEEERLARTGS